MMILDSNEDMRRYGDDRRTIEKRHGAYKLTQMADHNKNRFRSPLEELSGIRMSNDAGE